MTRNEAMEMYNALTVNAMDLPEVQVAIEAVNDYSASEACEDLFGSVLESSIDDVFAANEYEEAMENAVTNAFKTLWDKLQNAWKAFKHAVMTLLPRVKRVLDNMQRNAAAKKVNKMVDKNAKKYMEDQQMIKISENEDRVLSGKGGEPAASGSEHSMHPADLKRYVNDINAEAKKLDAELKACMKDPASAKEQVKELSKKLTFCTKQMKLCVAVMNRVAKYEQGKEFTKKEGMATDFEKIKTAKQNAFDAAKAGGKADVAAGKLFATKEEKK